MALPYTGFEWVSRQSLHDMVRESFRHDAEIKDRLHKAYAEYDKRTANVSDLNKKTIIFKEIVRKYQFREEWLLTKIHL